jgi:ABC-type multidrug transport system fused ATPase/permease subunit
MSSSTISVARDGWRLLVPAEKRRFAFLAVINLAAAAFEILSLTSIVPVIGLVFDPEHMTKGEYLPRVWRFFGEPSFDSFFMAVAATSAVLMLMSAAINVAAMWVTHRAGAAWQTRLADSLMRRSLYAPYTWFVDKNSAIIARILSNDLNFWWRDVIHRLIQIIAGVLTLALAIWLVLVAAPLIGLVVLGATIVLSYLIYRPFQPFLVRHAKISRDTANQMVRTATDGVAGVKDIKVANREAFFADLFLKAYRQSADSRAKTIIWNYVGPNILTLGGQIALVATSVALSRAGLDAVQLTTLMALMLLVASRVIPAVNRIAGAMHRLTDVAPYMHDIVELDRTLSAMAPRAEKLDAALEGPLEDWQQISITDLVYRYPRGDRAILDGVTLVIARGKSYGIVGGSGAGKTTLIDIMLGLLVPNEGVVRVDGRTPLDFRADAWRRQIAYVPQAPFFLDDTIRANIVFGLAAADPDDAAVWRVAKRAQIADFVADLPDSLDTKVGERAMRLSGGQRQRIAIARALLRAPTVLVLDEATNALDSASEQAVQAAIDGMRGEVTTIVVAHRMSAVRNCDTILVLDGGRLVAAGAYDELLATSDQFRKLAASVE